MRATALLAGALLAGCQPSTPSTEPSVSDAQLKRWTQDIHAKEASTRAPAETGLRSAGERGAAALIPCLEQRERRERCIEVIGAIGEPAVETMLEVARTSGPSHEDYLRREAGFLALQAMGSDAAPVSEPLLELIRDDQSELLQRWVAATWVHIGEAAMPSIEQAFFDERVADTGVDAAWRVGAPAIDFLLSTAASAESEERRQAAVFALGRMLRQSVREQGGLVLHSDQGHPTDFISIETGALHTRALATLCPQRSEAPPSADAVLQFWGTPAMVCAAAPKHLADARWLARRDSTLDPDRLLDLATDAPDPILRASAIGRLAQWAAQTNDAEQTAKARRITLNALDEPNPVGDAALDALPVYVADLDADGMRTVVDVRLRLAAGTMPPELPRWVLDRGGDLAFETVLQAFDDASMPMDQRVVALRSIARTDREDREPIVAALRRAEGSEHARIRSAAVYHIGIAEGTFDRLAIALRVANHLADPEAAVQLAVINVLGRIAPGAPKRRIRGSIPETDRWEALPARAFDRARCTKHRRPPTTEAAVMTWAVCRLFDATADADPDVAAAAREAIERAGFVAP